MTTRNFGSGVWSRSLAGMLLCTVSTAALAQSAQELDAITVTATKTEEKASESLSAISTVRQETFEQLAAKRLSDVFFGTPSVWFQERPDDPGTAFNVRGLQDFGRVAVVLDGARQNFQRTGHNADGLVYIEPEMLRGVDVVRGPVSNIYGSGAIGGVVSLQTKDIEDVVKAGERWGILGHAVAGSNQARGLGSAFGGIRVNPNIDLFAGGSFRKQSDYRDGNGDVVPRSWQEVGSGIAKVNVRPADGHEIKLGGIAYDAKFASGVTSSSTLYDSHVNNNTLTGRYTFARPDVPLVDFNANTYWNNTKVEQVKTFGAPSAATGAIGDARSFAIETTGFDIHNTSRFGTDMIKNAVTYGVDLFEDKVNVFDPTGTGDLFTPSGQRRVYGGFGQWQVKYGSLLEVLGALRYDAYELEGGGRSGEGDRLSPKLTVGLTPITGFTVYGTYAEGYRAPSVTETLVAGLHPVQQAPFTFVPNPDLRPEVGKNKEVGVNLSYNDIFTKGDRFRAKANVYRNDVDDFIDQVAFGPPQTLCFIPGVPLVRCPPAARGVFPYTFIQYQNIAAARLQGAEFESIYDAGLWFTGLSGHYIEGTNVDTGAELVKIPPHQITGLVGLRWWDNKITTVLRVQHVFGKDNNPSTGLPSDPYNLAMLYVGYQPTPDVLASFSVDNLFNTYYVRHLDALPSPGITFKGSLQVRFGGA